MAGERNRMEAVINLCKRRGFVFPAAELYGGLGGFYDYGPLGTQLKRNIEREWWRYFVQSRDDVVGIETAVVTKFEILKASGHLENFTDPLVECKVCHERFRADHADEIQAHRHQGKFTEPKPFHTMFTTHVGVVEDETSTAFLRPENAQGMFTNFLNILDTTRRRIPFGIAQIGRSFRNEITYRNFLFRQREFTIAELEYFVKPGTDEEYFETWLRTMESALVERFGLSAKNLRRHEHPKDKLSHYSKRTVDILYHYPWGWDELWGLANRRDYDLTQHEQATGKKLMYRDPETGETYRPYVIEPTGGIDRLLLAILCESFETVTGGRTTTTESIKAEETVLRLPWRLAPFSVAVLPLSKKPLLVEHARKITADLRQEFFVDYDETGSIGKRYRRQDEVGTPFCVTVDFDTVEGKSRAPGTVTIRNRDTMAQDIVKEEEIADYLITRIK